MGQVTKFMVPGGLHRARIGDIINNRYKIKAVHSTIWSPPVLLSHFPSDSGFINYLAKDVDSKYVCLQILGATSSVDPVVQAEQELLDRLVNGDEAGRDLIHAPMEKFWTEGPNGKHQCLVYNLFTVTLENSICPVSMVKRLAGDALKSIEYVHNKGVCHTGLYLLLLYTVEIIHLTRCIL